MSLSDSDLRLLEEGASTFSFQIDPARIQKLNKFAEMLYATNQRMNLTSVSREEFMTLHVLDSLSVMPIIGGFNSKRIVDIGTGGGFPGIPLAIFSEEIDYTLIDSTEKKVFFLRDVIHSLDLKKVRAVHGRAEEIGRDRSHRELYDLAVARAVTSLHELAPLFMPFLSKGGIGVAMKGDSVTDEIDALKGGKFETAVKSVKKLTLPGSNISRALVIIENE